MRTCNSVEDDSVGGVKDGPCCNTARKQVRKAPMQTEPYGACSPKRTEVSPPDKSDDPTECAFCDALADGYDARTHRATCTRCVHLRADGGISPETAGASLSKFELRVLALLASHDDAPKGVTLKRELRSYYGKDINHGQLYPNLDDLVEAGYVEKGQKDRRTNAYSLTDEGRAVLLSEIRWLASQVPDFDSNAEVFRGP